MVKYTAHDSNYKCSTHFGLIKLFYHNISQARVAQLVEQNSEEVNIVSSSLIMGKIRMLE